MLKIALPSSGDQVDGHFGHCQYFTIFTADDAGKIISEERLSSPPGCGCKSNVVPELAKMGVTLMLAGNMGLGAVNMLGMHGIRVVRGCSGSLRSVTEAFLAGQVADSGQACSHHDHEGCHSH